MLSHNNILKLLAFTESEANVETLRTFVKLMKHKPLTEVLRITDARIRQAKLTNLLWTPPGFFQTAEDKLLNEIFASLEKYITGENPLVTPANPVAFCTELLALDLTVDVKKSIQAFIDLQGIVDQDGAIKPLWQMPVGPDWFAQLERSNQSFSALVHNFFPQTLDTHNTLREDEVEEAKQQTALDAPRERFQFITPIGTIIAGPMEERPKDDNSSDDEEESAAAASPSKVTLSYPLLLQKPGKNPTLMFELRKPATDSAGTKFVSKLFNVINRLAPMDPALIDFLNVYALHQSGPHGLPAIVFQALIQTMQDTHFNPDSYNVPVCLHALQHGLRSKKLVFHYINEHEIEMSWAGEEEHFMVRIRNKYHPSSVNQTAVVADDTTPENNFRDITVCLEKFSIPICAAEFDDATPIEQTAAYAEHSTVSISYQTCCDLFWQVYAAYVIQAKAGKDNAVTKENDLPALLMRCAAQLPDADRGNIVQAIAFHWLKLINAGNQKEVKAQMSWPVGKIIDKLPDDVKMMFAITKGSPLSATASMSTFWRQLTRPSTTSTPSVSLTGMQADSTEATSIRSGESSASLDSVFGPARDVEAPIEAIPTLR